MPSLSAAPLLAVFALAIGACSGGNAASQLAKPPDYNPKGESKCGVTKSQAEPLIVEWPDAARGKLEAQVRKGLVAVRYQGCEMEVLGQCSAKGQYGYAGLTRKKSRVTMKDADDLYANIPVGAARLEAKLQNSGELNVAMTIVGRLEADRSSVRADELQGSCEGATHLITAVTVGAFDFFAGADAEVGGGANVAGVGAGARSTAKREMLNQDGDDASCEKSADDDKRPPQGCAALLRVEVVPLVGAVVSRASGGSPFAGTWQWSCCGNQYHGTVAILPDGPNLSGAVKDATLPETDPIQGAIKADGIEFTRTQNGQRWVLTGSANKLRGRINGRDDSDVEMWR